MSVAVAVRKGKDLVLASDTQTNFGSFKVKSENHRADKIRRVGSALLATTGWGLYENILDDLLSARAAPRLNSKQQIFSFFLALWKALHQRYPFVNDQSEGDHESPFGDMDASFLVVNSSGIFYVARDLSVTEFDEYYAIGSGSDFSLGALHALYETDSDAATLARKAVEAAIAFSLHCGGEVRIEKKIVRPSRRRR